MVSALAAAGWPEVAWACTHMLPPARMARQHFADTGLCRVAVTASVWMPVLQVIAQYVLDKWSAVGPSMMASDAEARATANLAARIHDQYITPIQVGSLADWLTDWREQCTTVLSFTMNNT